MEPILIDTNLLVYVYDRRDPVRQQTARRLVGTIARLGNGCLSAQCLSEFFSVSTRRKGNQSPILSIMNAGNETEKLARVFAVYPVTQQIVLEAIRGVRQHKLQFWDALIWSVARLNQIPTVFSEDFSIGTTIDGVRFINPLVRDFSLQDWLSER